MRSCLRCRIECFEFIRRSRTSSSTGVIGWRLPVNEMIEAVPRAVHDTVRICTSSSRNDHDNRFVPQSSFLELIGENNARLVGIAKGAGMIEPNLATMLVFLMTDLIFPDTLQDINTCNRQFLQLYQYRQRREYVGYGHHRILKSPVKSKTDLQDFEPSLDVSATSSLVM